MFELPNKTFGSSNSKAINGASELLFFDIYVLIEVRRELVLKGSWQVKRIREYIEVRRELVFKGSWHVKRIREYIEVVSARGENGRTPYCWKCVDGGCKWRAGTRETEVSLDGWCEGGLGPPSHVAQNIDFCF